MGFRGHAILLLENNVRDGLQKDDTLVKYVSDLALLSFLPDTYS